MKTPERLPISEISRQVIESLHAMSVDDWKEAIGGFEAELREADILEASARLNRIVKPRSNAATDPAAR